MAVQKVVLLVTFLCLPVVGCVKIPDVWIQYLEDLAGNAGNAGHVSHYAFSPA